MLLIDHLQDVSEGIARRKEKMHLLERQYKQTFDRSAKQEMSLLKTEIRRMLSELRLEILVRLQAGDLPSAFARDVAEEISSVRKGLAVRPVVADSARAEASVEGGVGAGARGGN